MSRPLHAIQMIARWRAEFRTRLSSRAPSCWMRGANEARNMAPPTEPKVRGSKPFWRVRKAPEKRGFSLPGAGARNRRVRNAPPGRKGNLSGRCERIGSPMRLREALDLCTDRNSGDWRRVPGTRPATTMLAGSFDPGAKENDTRPLAGHSIAVYEPDARLSLVWPVPEDHEDDLGDRSLPEWAENDDPHEWKAACSGWAVVLLSGAPIWQVRVWYLDWGSGIGGYVSDFSPVYADDEPLGRPELAGWTTSEWEIGLARLLNTFSPTPSGDFASFEPTSRVVPEPSKIHPTDEQMYD